MKLSKTMIISGIVTTVVIVGLGTIIIQNDQEKNITMEEQIKSDSDSNDTDRNKVADDISTEIDQMANEIE
jgi:hypothetical protein